MSNKVKTVTKADFNPRTFLSTIDKGQRSADGKKSTISFGTRDHAEPHPAILSSIKGRSIHISDFISENMESIVQAWEEGAAQCRV